MKKIITYVLFLSTALLSQNIKKQNTDIYYKNEHPVSRKNYNDAETLYIEAATYFKEKLPVLLLNTNESNNEFELIKGKFQNIINNFPNSNLADDSQLAIAEAAKHLNNLDLYESELNKVIDNFPDQHLTYLNFENPFCNQVLPAVQSSSLQTDALAKFQLAMIYYSPYIIKNIQDYEEAITRFKNVISEFPFSYCSALAQYYLASSYDALSFSTNVDKNLVAEEYEKVFDLYKNYSLEYAELSMGRIGDYAIKYLPEKMEYYKSKIKNNYSPTDYLAESRFQSNGNAKWNKNNLSLSFVRQGSGLTSEDSLVVNEIINKFNNTFSGLISVQLTSNTASDIKIEFSQSRGNFTQLNTRNKSETVNEITSSVIFLKTNSSLEKRKEIALHELCHSIGLDHSFDNNDLMYFSGNNKFEFSERDIATIQKLYSINNSAPEFLTLPYTPRISPGEKLYLDLDCQDLDFENPLYSIKGKPDWLNIDQYTGIITGTPTEKNLGYYEFEITLTDNQQTETKILWKLMINNDPAVTNIESIKFDNAVFRFSHPYPNPMNPASTVKLLSEINTEIVLSVYNILGEQICSKEITVAQGINHLRIDLSHQPGGVYFYKTTHNRQLLINGKLVLIK